MHSLRHLLTLQSIRYCLAMRPEYPLLSVMPAVEDALLTAVM
jgi:hypothetical protein